jgi:sugar lactone lactonase YvrE
VVDATDLYCTDTNNSRVLRIDKRSGRVTTFAGGLTFPLAQMLGGGLACARALALGGAYVYVAAGCDGMPNGRVLAIAKRDGTAHVVAAGQNTPASLAVDARRVYWTCSNSLHGSIGTADAVL